jgi:hypothetical protein
MSNESSRSGRDGFVQGLEAALFALHGSEGDIDFLKFKLERLIKENREVLAKESAPKGER